MDSSCNVGVIQRDFLNNKEISAKVSQAYESDINLDDFEMADIEEPDQEEKVEEKTSVAEVMEKKDEPKVKAVADEVENQNMEVRSNKSEVHVPPAVEKIAS